MAVYGRPPYLHCIPMVNNIPTATAQARLRFKGGQTIAGVHEQIWRHMISHSLEGYALKMRLDDVYETLWELYVCENPGLIRPLLDAPGLSDNAWQGDRLSVAHTLWRIRNLKLFAHKVGCWDCGRRMNPNPICIHRDGQHHICSDCWRRQQHEDRDPYRTLAYRRHS